MNFTPHDQQQYPRQPTTSIFSLLGVIKQA